MPLVDLFFSMFWFFVWIAWIWAVISVFIDIFRSPDLGGWAKALWALVVIVLPLFGVLIYLIVRGGEMHERAAKQVADQERATQQYIRDAAGSSASTSDELAKMAKLRDDGVLTDEEFSAQKAKLLA